MGEIIIKVNNFDLSATLECGQVFRYKRINGSCKLSSKDKSNCSYEVFSKDKHCRISQSGDEVKIISEDCDYFIQYFAFNENYDEKYAKIISVLPEICSAAECGKGIRLLKQDTLEMIISFIISANNNIPRIQGIIERICAAVGSLNEWGYAFPTLAQLRTLSETDLKALGAGYRAGYIATAAIQITGDFLEKLKNAASPCAQKMLLGIKGVGEKVADCILLFGMGRGDTFPVDVWMENALKSESLNTNAKIRTHYLNLLGDCAGLAQQYIYHYSRNVNARNVKER